MKTILSLTYLILFTISLAAQVEKIKDLGSDFNFSEFITINDHLVFIEDERNQNKKVWLSDGTNAGTQVVFESFDSPHFLQKINNQLFFAVDTKIYQLDINSSSVNEVFNAFGTIERLHVFQDELFFTTAFNSFNIFHYDPAIDSIKIISGNFSGFDNF